MRIELSKPASTRFGFWLLAFGFWLLAFGFWLLAFQSVGFDTCMRIRFQCRRIVTFPPLRRVPF
ncbi:hypothetical protein F3J43_18915 [Pantoea sp. Cy-639]|nr:hypothetical protein [Pantoea sp. Cy-639]